MIRCENARSRASTGWSPADSPGRCPPLSGRRARGPLAWLRAPEHRHFLLLAFWPVYMLAYVLIGRLGGRVEVVSTATALDARIPFLPGFVIPYLGWILLLVALLAYGAFREPRMFTRMMLCLMAGFSTAVLIFWLFPTCCGLRPEVLPERGLCASLVRFVYWVDADANACPSEHIIGVFAIAFAVWDSKALSRPWIRGATLLASLAIAASTVLIKQHAALDLIAAVPVSLLSRAFACRLTRGR